jgi:hypothetical protein
MLSPTPSSHLQRICIITSADSIEKLRAQRSVISGLYTVLNEHLTSTTLRQSHLLDAHSATWVPSFFEYSHAWHMLFISVLLIVCCSLPGIHAQRCCRHTAVNYSRLVSGHATQCATRVMCRCGSNYFRCSRQHRSVPRIYRSTRKQRGRWRMDGSADRACRHFLGYHCSDVHAYLSCGSVSGNASHQ